MRIVTIVIAALFASPLYASAQTCSERTLHGDYGIQISGTRPAAPTPSAPVEQLIGGGMGHFDGQGGYSLTGFTHGAITGVTVGQRGSGSYQVSADCTGTITFQNEGQPFAIQVVMVVVDEGKEVRGVTVSPAPVLVTAVWRRK
jgi:hypothetical protein